MRCAPTSGWKTTPKPPPNGADAIKRQVRDAFYTDTDAWKQRIVEQGLEAARQALAGLARPWGEPSSGPEPGSRQNR